MFGLVDFYKINIIIDRDRIADFKYILKDHLFLFYLLFKGGIKYFSLERSILFCDDTLLIFGAWSFQLSALALSYAVI